MLVRLALSALLALCVAVPTATAGLNDPDIAALQVGLRARGVYGGPVDGQAGPATVTAVRNLRGNPHLGAGQLLDRRTRAALGNLGQHALGSRSVTEGAVGWDVAAVQYMLAWHGFPSSTFDGAFGSHGVRALEKFERWAHLPVDGVVGPAVLAALRRPAPTCPIPLHAPLTTGYTDGFGPRENSFHTGVDFPAPTGTPVAVAAPGRVTWAGDLGGGWGIVVVVAHRSGVRTMYAHLSRVAVYVGQRVRTGETIGAVGATGHATGPHVHFEVRLRGAAVDPLPALRRTGAVTRGGV